MGQIQGISGVIGLDNSPAVKAFDEVAKGAEDLKKKVEGNTPDLGVNTDGVDDALEDTEEKAQGFFDRLALKAQALRMDDRKSGETALGSFFGRGIEGMADFGLSAAGVGGAATAISGVAKAANEVATKINEINALVASGKANWADVTMEIGKSTPVLSEIFKLGETLNETFTGNKAALAEENAEIERMNTLMEAQVAHSNFMRDAMDGYAAKARATAAEIAAINAEMMKMPGKAAEIRGDAAIEQQIEAANEAFRQQMDGFKERRDKVLEPMRASRDAAAKTIEAEGAGRSVDEVREKAASHAGWRDAVGGLLAEYDMVRGQIRDKEKTFHQERETLEKKHLENIAGIRLKGQTEAAQRAANAPGVKVQEQWGQADATAGMGPEEKRIADLLAANQDMSLEMQQSLMEEAIARDGAVAAAERLKDVTAEQLAMEKERQAIIDQQAKEGIEAAAEAGAAFGRERDAMEAEAQRLNESAMTEEEKRDAFNKRLGELYEAGLLKDGVYSTLYKDEKPAAGKEDGRPPELIMSGTAEAFAAKFANLSGDEMVQLAKQQLKATEAAPQAIGEEVARAMASQEDAVTDLAGVA